MALGTDQTLRKADALFAKGRIAEAQGLYQEVLRRFPANRRAIDGLRGLKNGKATGSYREGVEAILAVFDQGRLAEALLLTRRLIEVHPFAPDLHNLAGVALAGTGQREAALASYDAAIALKPDHGDAWSNRGILLSQLGRTDDALLSHAQAVAIAPGNAGSHVNHALVLRQMGRLDEAVASYAKAIRIQPDCLEAWFNRGNAHLERKSFAEAVRDYDTAIRLRPDHLAALCNRGNALRELGRLDAALADHDAAIALAPDHAEAHCNRGIVLMGLKRAEEALDACRTAFRLAPEAAEIHYNYAIVLQEMGRCADALIVLDNAVRLAPDHGKAHSSRGAALHELGRLDEAAAAYGEALRIAPDEAADHYGLGNVLQELQRLDAAVESYARAIALQPDYPEARAQMLYHRARMGLWEDVDDLATELRSLGLTTRPVTPFSFLALEDDPQHHLLRARKWIAKRHGPVDIRPPATAPAPASPGRQGRIRIGYFSADFHNHATMHLIAGLLERHDRSRFEIHAFSYGIARHDTMRERAIGAVDRFHDVARFDDAAIAALARREGIDIAVDLKGHTQGMRSGIFAARAAPVQIAYLGYPGSSGADFIDYIVADERVIPVASRIHYSEKIIALPDCYQATDRSRPIGAEVRREEVGLPAEGFVFCSFNSNYKITPAEFDIWMRLLDRVGGSMLWLLRENGWAEANLRRAAAARGIDPDRLIFADRMAPADHLARQRCADLFLDSFACNAHTTASDALWAGLPLLTRSGESFAARVATSLLHAIGLPELATDSAEAYERMALGLATDPARLAALRDRLAANRLTMPLFDTDRLTRHLEAGYALVLDRHARGLAPDHVAVAAIDGEAERLVA